MNQIEDGCGPCSQSQDQIPAAKRIFRGAILFTHNPSEEYIFWHESYRIFAKALSHLNFDLQKHIDDETRKSRLSHCFPNENTACTFSIFLKYQDGTTHLKDVLNKLNEEFCALCEHFDDPNEVREAYEMMVDKYESKLYAGYELRQSGTEDLHPYRRIQMHGQKPESLPKSDKEASCLRPIKCAAI
jgi:hypothetical protein